MTPLNNAFWTGAAFSNKMLEIANLTSTVTEQEQHYTFQVSYIAMDLCTMKRGRKMFFLAPQAEDNQETDKGIIFSLLSSCPL